MREYPHAQQDGRRQEQKNVGSHIGFLHLPLRMHRRLKKYGYDQEKRRQALISDRLGKSGYVHGYEHSFHTSAGCPAG